MRNILAFLTIVFLGIGTGQLFTFFQSRQIRPTGKPIEISPEATTTAILGKESVGEIAVVSRVIDGDTVELADGRRVRYIGIDTPEAVDPRKPVECFAREAKEENRRFVEGKTVRLEKDISETDNYGRLLRYVYRGEVLVNESLLRNGFAHASTYPPDVRYQDRLVAAEREARENKRGLWAGCTNPASDLERLQDQAPSPTPRSSNSSCVIKGNISSSGENIYHLPGCGSYGKTGIDESRGERWFCTEEEAVRAGWRKAKNCP